MTTPETQLWQALGHAVSGRETDLAAYPEPELLRTAARHGVSQMLDKRAREGSAKGLSADARKQLGEATRVQAALDLLLNDSTAKTLRLLAENEIPVLLLKGTPVAHLYYDHSYERPRCDSDLYIAEQDVSRTAELLAASGYQVSGLGGRPYSSKQFGAATNPFQNAWMTFDIHWKLSNRILFQTTLPFEDCWQGRQPVAALGPGACAPCAIDLLLHACIHRIGHGRNTERNRLIWLYDVHVMVNVMDEDELQQFAIKAAERKVGVLCADALEVTEELFGTRPTSELRAQLRTNYKREPSAPLINASKLRWAWTDFWALEGFGNKVAFARELLAGKKKT